MSYGRMGYRTREAKGVQLKGGAVRRITITLDEEVFLAIKASAIKNRRSLSNEMAIYLRHFVPIPQRGESGTARKAPSGEAVATAAAVVMTEPNCSSSGAPEGERRGTLVRSPP